jgi:hypothetical protein
MLAASLLVLGAPLHITQVIMLGSAPLERRQLIGQGGRRCTIRFYRELRGPAARIVPLRLYPALLNVLLGEASFVGLTPLTPQQWAAAAEAYRLNPPQAPIGLISEFGGVISDMEEAEGDRLTQLQLSNRRYTKGWHLAEDFRILLTVLQRQRVQEGGGALK